jgi:hypothetical protein
MNVLNRHGSKSRGRTALASLVLVLTLAGSVIVGTSSPAGAATSPPVWDATNKGAVSYLTAGFGKYGRGYYSLKLCDKKADGYSAFAQVDVRYGGTAFTRSQKYAVSKAGNCLTFTYDSGSFLVPGVSGFSLKTCLKDSAGKVFSCTPRKLNINR